MFYSFISLSYGCFRFNSLFVWLVAGGWCWFVVREKYCWLVAGGWFVLREKYCWLVADKPNEQVVSSWWVTSIQYTLVLGSSTFQVSVYLALLV
jgi:hypothetical protein